MTPDFSASFWQNKKALTDSRKLVLADKTIFFAIDGKNHDGHRFIDDLYQKGVRHFVVEKEADVFAQKYPDAYWQQVPSAIKTLQQWAGYHRANHEIPVIGITGSNGKTIVKEWLYLLLESDFRIVKSPKSYNSQIGVPLSVLEMTSRHQLAIFEAGISQSNEMANLQKVIKPSVGIFTNIGTAHDENFGSVEEKIIEKLKLFQGTETLIYCSDHELLHRYAHQLPAKPFTWGNEETATVSYEILDRQSGNLTIKLHYRKHVGLLYFPFSDQASFENAMTCVATLLFLGYSLDQLQAKLNLLRSHAKQVTMRLELKQGRNNCLMVNDAYNNDLAGLAVALEFTSQQDEIRPRTLILSDMLEAGLPETHLYNNVRILAESKSVKRIIGVGKTLLACQDIFDGLQTAFFPTTQALISAIQEGSLPFTNELILVKGARAFGFEQVVNLLEQKVHGTRLEINLDAIAHNLNFYRSLLQNGTKIMVMVKGFGYGSGSLEVAHLLQYHLIDYLGVAYTDEGISLREGGIRLPIMVLNPPEETFESLFAYQLEPEIYSFSQLAAFLYFLKRKTIGHKKPYRIHLNLDTGMNRLGFSENEWETLGKQLAENQKLIRVGSIYSHLAAADEAEHQTFTKGQISLFNKGYNAIAKKLKYEPLKHLLNSPGITRYPEAQFDMVRLGIGLYGIEVNQFYQEHLQPTGTLKTTISQIREIDAHQTVGYGRKGKKATAARIAIMAIGYADGYSRRFSNGVGKVWVNGQLAPVIGNVCMDMTMIDITGIQASEGDEVIVFGKEIPIWELSQAIGTIPYEVLTGISGRVKRIYYSE